MTKVTRNEAGFTSFPKGHPLENVDMANKLKYATWYDDYLEYDITQLIGSPYNLTATNGVDTILGPTGVWTGTLAGADNDLIQLQTVEAPWQTNGKRLYYMARFNLNIAGGTIAQNELFIGLASNQQGTAFFAADGVSLTMDDAIGFFQFDGTASMGVTMREADVGSEEAGVLTLTDATWVTVLIAYDGAKADFYTSLLADGSDMRADNPQATLTSVDATSVMTPCVYLKAGEAQGNILSVDYQLVIGER